MKQTLKALLATASFLVIAGPAMAQSAPVQTWSLGNITNASTNTGAVSLSGNLDDSPTITVGSSNSISAAAVGASASDGITLFADGGSTAGGTVTSGTVSLTATNDTSGTVSATTDILGGTISNGVSNSISGAAVGSSASFSVVTVNEGAATAPTTAVTVGDQTLASTNNEAVTFIGDMGVTGGTDTPTVADGQLNSISIAGVGASGSTSYLSVNEATSASAQDFTIGAAGITVINSGGVTVTSNIFGGTISAGANNSISMAAVGGSASTNFTLLGR